MVFLDKTKEISLMSDKLNKNYHWERTRELGKYCRLHRNCQISEQYYDDCI